MTVASSRRGILKLNCSRIICSLCKSEWNEIVRGRNHGFLEGRNYTRFQSKIGPSASGSPRPPGVGWAHSTSPWKWAVLHKPITAIEPPRPQGTLGTPSEPTPLGVATRPTPLCDGGSERTPEGSILRTKGVSTLMPLRCAPQKQAPPQT